MIDENMPLELRIESAVVLGSLAKGTEENIRGLLEAGTISVLLKGENTQTLTQSSGNMLDCRRQGPIFCLLLGVSSDYAQPITGQATEVTCPVIGRAQPELTLSKRQKMGPGCAIASHLVHLECVGRMCQPFSHCLREFHAQFR